MVEPEERERGNNPAQPAHAASSGGGRLYSEAVKEPTFGSERKDSRPIFEAKLLSPEEQLHLKEILEEFTHHRTKSTLCGLHYEGKDLIASFLGKEERDRLCQGKKLKVKGIEISVSFYPPKKEKFSSLFRYSLSHVPMSATSLAIEKALHPLVPRKYLIEKYAGSNVRTGRVIFWIAKKTEVDFLLVNDKKAPVKSLDKEKAATGDGSGAPATAEAKANAAAKAPSATPKKAPNGTLSEKKESQDRQELPPMDVSDEEGHEESSANLKNNGSATPKGKSASGSGGAPTTPSNPPQRNCQDPLQKGSTTLKRGSEEISPISPKSSKYTKTNLTEMDQNGKALDSTIFEAIGLKTPTNNAVLSIYENLAHETESVGISKKVPSDMGKGAKKERVLMPRGNGYWDLYALTSAGTREGMGLITELFKTYMKNEEYSRKGWAQSIPMGGYLVLVLYKSRILRDMEKPS